MKPSVCAIIATDDSIKQITDTDTNRFLSGGSGVIMNWHNTIYVLTNEHVVAFKNDENRTVRLFKQIQVIVNSRNGGSTLLPAKIVKTDEINDLAAIVLYTTKASSTIDIVAIKQNMWKESSACLEGNLILYFGFPANWGFKSKLYPLSKTGIISQIIPNENYFLIDAFVQSGYSGSPVFLMRNEDNRLPARYAVYFIGIIRAFPFGLGNIYSVKLEELAQLKYIENPGFSVVINTQTIGKLFESIDK